MARTLLAPPPDARGGDALDAVVGARGAMLYFNLVGQHVIWP
jgi:hypothetical protein